mgnify:CR=1 FL=1
MEDRDIIGLFRKRSEDAINETAKKYGKYCHYIAYNILNNGRIVFVKYTDGTYSSYVIPYEK